MAIDERDRAGITESRPAKTPGRSGTSIWAAIVTLTPGTADQQVQVKRIQPDGSYLDDEGVLVAARIKPTISGMGLGACMPPIEAGDIILVTTAKSQDEYDLETVAEYTVGIDCDVLS